MADAIAFDTTFLIDLQRELRRDGDGPAQRLLRRYARAPSALPIVAFGEFAEGFDDPGHPLLAQVRNGFRLLPVDQETALLYAQTALELRHTGKLIGTNDMWIGVAALRHGLPLVTRNTKHFARIERLQLVHY